MDLDEVLIEEVRKHRLLYDLEMEGYKNLRLKDRAWKEVSINVNFDEAQCKKRWRGLRDCYKRCKRNAILSSGSGAVAPKKQWRYYGVMSFLDQMQSSRSTIGNIPADDSIEVEAIISEFSEHNNEVTVHSSSTEESLILETPTTSKRARKESEAKCFKDFLAVASECIKETTSTFASRNSEIDPTALLFAGLALQIKTSNIPPIAVNHLQQKISSLVYEEVEKYL